MKWVGYFIVLVCALYGANGQYGNTPYAELDLLPGLDFVGFGYDARFDTASTALQVPIADYTFTKAKRFSYPTFRSGVFRVPDQIYVRNVAYTEAEAYLFNSLEEYKKRIAVGAGMDYDRFEGSGLRNLQCESQVNEESNETVSNCTTISEESEGTFLSMGGNVNYVRETFASQEVFLIENSEKTQLYHIFLDSRYYRQTVKDEMRNLTLRTFAEDPQLYFRFLEKYGTHYVVAATIGGMVTMTTTTSQSLSSTSDTLGVGVRVGGGRISSQDALQSASASFSASLNVEVDFSFSRVDRSISFESSSDWLLIGGDTSLVNLLDTRNSAEAIKEWKQTITSNAVPVGYRLREISTLFDDPILRKELSDAVQVYLNFDTSGVVEISNFNGLPIPVFSD